VNELSEMKPNLVDRTCKLLKWVCRCGQMELEGEL